MESGNKEWKNNIKVWFQSLKYEMSAFIRNKTKYMHSHSFHMQLHLRYCVTNYSTPFVFTFIQNWFHKYILTGPPKKLLATSLEYNNLDINKIFWWWIWYTQIHCTYCMYVCTVRGEMFILLLVITCANN